MFKAIGLNSWITIAPFFLMASANHRTCLRISMPEEQTNHSSFAGRTAIVAQPFRRNDQE
jgi:hypothetical protein